MRTVFLLGSGISVDAGMPRVDEITSQVVSGEGVFLHTDKTFVLGASDPNYERLRPQVEPVLALLRDLRRRSHTYFGRDPDYEEISMLLWQLHDALSGEYESPAIMPFVAELLRSRHASGSLEGLRVLSEQARHYVSDTVRQLLCRDPTGLRHLQCIVVACEALPRVDLVTLNHDLVLEAALEAGRVSYADGFDRVGDDVRLWDNEWGDARVRLLKLHGSLDWWGYEVAQQPWRGWTMARYCGTDALHPTSRRVIGPPHDLRPVFLTGTFNKTLAYESWIFPEHHARFHEAMRETSRIVVAGYGFRDKAINSRLIGWLARALSNRLIICHPASDRLRSRARGAIQNHWADWQKRGQLAIVPAYVSEVDYDAIEAYLG